MDGACGAAVGGICVLFALFSYAFKLKKYPVDQTMIATYILSSVFDMSVLAFEFLMQRAS